MSMGKGEQKEGEGEHFSAKLIGEDARGAEGLGRPRAWNACSPQNELSHEGNESFRQTELLQPW